MINKIPKTFQINNGLYKDSSLMAFQDINPKKINQIAPSKATGMLNNIEKVLVLTKEQDTCSEKSQNVPFVGGA